MKRVLIIISGRVQGVCFRATTCDKANALGVCGYVKNLTDGRLEIVAEGEETALAQFIDWCHKGPPIAEVEDVRLSEQDVNPGEYSRFAIQY